MNLENKDEIKELFSSKMKNAEVPVSSDLWNKVSANISKTSLITSGVSVLSKIIIAASIGVTATLTSLYFLSNKNQIKLNEQITLKKELEEKNIVDKKTIDEKYPIVNNNDKKTIEESRVNKKTTNKDSFPKTRIPVLEINKHIFIKSNEQNTINNQPRVVSTSPKEPLKDLSTIENGIIINEELEEKKISNTYIGELPNVFTPNGDNENDKFFIEVKNINDFVLTILNVKNEVVYKTTDASFIWEGKDLYGNIVNNGSYIYFFTGKDDLGNPVSKYNKLEIRY